jgi:hemerythrin superfamily protein
MEQKETQRKIRSLIQLDIDATHAYQHAIDKTEHRVVRDQLILFQKDHERHVRELSAKLVRMGEKAPDSPDLKGYLIEGFTGLRSSTGTKGALKAMQTNEKLTNRKYEEAAKEDFPPEIRSLIESNRQDEAKHLRYVEQMLAEKVWETQQPTRSATMHDQLFNTLKTDHDEVKKIFTRIRESESTSERRNLVDTLRKEILPHMIAEEKIVYASLRERKEPWSDALEGLEEHHAAQMVLRELAAMSPEDERFRAKATVLKEMVEHHFREEEDKIFRHLKEVLSEDKAGEVLDSFNREKELAQTKYPNIPSVTSEQPEIRVH